MESLFKYREKQIISYQDIGMINFLILITDLRTKFYTYFLLRKRQIFNYNLRFFILKISR